METRGINVDKNRQIEGFLNNLIAAATWDGIKRGLVCSLMTGLGTAIWEKLKHGSLDWYAIGGMFILTLIVVMSIFRKKESVSGPPRATEPDGHSSANNGTGGEYYEKLAAKDSVEMHDRLILCGTSAKLNVDTVEPYIDVVFTIVNASMFSVMSETVEGNAFYRGYSGEKCYFSRTPIIVDSINLFTLGRATKGELILRQFVPLAITDNIAANRGKLKIDFGEVRVNFQFPGTARRTRFSWLGDEVEVFRQNGAPAAEPSLRSRLIATSDELMAFVKQHGTGPSIARNPEETAQEYIPRTWEARTNYSTKMGADFRMRLADSVKQLRDEIQVQGAGSEKPLDDAIRQAESQACTAESVMDIRRHFWLIAEKLEN
jgi:hypothetical protein